MKQSKEDFIKSFLPDEVESVELTQINMDITDLGLADILRNLHKLYPINSRSRNNIVSGTKIIGVLCKTRTLAPLNGLFIIVGSSEVLKRFQILSTNYLILCLSEKTICSDELIHGAIYEFTSYLAKEYRDVIDNLPDLYRKFIYDPFYDLVEDDYTTDDF